MDIGKNGGNFPISVVADGSARDVSRFTSLSFEINDCEKFPLSRRKGEKSNYAEEFPDSSFNCPPQKPETTRETFAFQKGKKERKKMSRGILSNKIRLKEESSSFLMPVSFSRWTFCISLLFPFSFPSFFNSSAKKKGEEKGVFCRLLFFEKRFPQKIRIVIMYPAAGGRLKC